MTIVYSKNIKRVTSLGNEGTKRIMHNGILIWPINLTPEDLTPYITFSSSELTTFYFERYDPNHNSTFQISVEYSLNNGNWNSYTAGTNIVFGGSLGNLRLRGTGNLNGTSLIRQQSNPNNGYVTICHHQIHLTALTYCSGDIRTLIDYQTYETVDTSNACFRVLFFRTPIVTAPLLPMTNLYSACYESLFEGCTSLTQAPLLPATVVSDFSYSRMFYGCTSLTQAPLLPATTLNNFSYSRMFYGCSALTLTPSILPATTMARYCFNQMFHSCASLSQAPLLPATTLAYGCYAAMFKNCQNLTTGPSIIPASIAPDYCFNNMFNNCVKLTLAPLLPATTLGEYCYRGMFFYCYALTQAPELPARKLAPYCYYEMFRACRNLTYIKMMATNISASNCMRIWVQGVSSSGTFVKNARATWNKTGEDGIPTGWTVQTATT